MEANVVKNKTIVSRFFSQEFNLNLLIAKTENTNQNNNIECIDLQTHMTNNMNNKHANINAQNITIFILTLIVNHKWGKVC